MAVVPGQLHGPEKAARQGEVGHAGEPPVQQPQLVCEPRVEPSRARERAQRRLEHPVVWDVWAQLVA